MDDLYKEFGLEKGATEAQIRDAVGAPSREEDELCMCGELLSECKEAYEHMTMGY